MNYLKNLTYTSIKRIKYLGINLTKGDEIPVH